MMMSKSLVNMAKTPEEIEKEKGEGVEWQPDKYPWGLELRLGTEELKKLGITEMPPLGSQVQITAVADIERLSEHKDAENGEDQSMTLQITDIALDFGAERSDEDRAASMYSDGSQ
jgi:hypothetical protein